MSAETTTIDYLMNVNTAQAERSISKLQSQLMQVTRQIVRLTGQEDLGRMMQLMQRAIALAQALQLAYSSLQVAATSGRDPLAWISFGMALTTTGIMAYEFGVWTDDMNARSRGY